MLNGACLSWEDDWIETKKVVYARFRWTMAIKVFAMRLFYDWVEVEEVT
jgi:hypothetical protein